MRGIEFIDVDRAELLRKVAEFAELPAFQHRPELRSTYLLGLLPDGELLKLVRELEAEFAEGLGR